MYSGFLLGVHCTLCLVPRVAGLRRGGGGGHCLSGAKLIEMQFSKLMEKLRDSELSTIRHLLLDLAVAFSPHLSESSLTLLFNFTSPLLDVRSRGSIGRGFTVASVL